MKEELIKALLATLNETKAFVLAQAPDVFKQAISYYLVDATVWIGVGSCFLVAAFYGHKTIQSMIKIDRYSEAPIFYLGVVISALIGVFVFFAGVCAFFQLITAPKWYLIHALTH